MVTRKKDKDIPARDLTMKDLEKCFNEASEQGAKYIGVFVKMEGFPTPEMIINENLNIVKKLEYYKSAYNKKLILKSFNGIRIIGFAYGDALSKIEKKMERMGAIATEI